MDYTLSSVTSANIISILIFQTVIIHQILTASPLEDWRRPLWCPPYYVDEDYPGPEINEPPPQRSNWRGSESPTLDTDVYVWCYALIVVHARMPEMSEWIINQSIIYLATV